MADGRAPLEQMFRRNPVETGKPKSTFGEHQARWVDAMDKGGWNSTAVMGNETSSALVQDRRDLWERNGAVVGMTKYFAQKELSDLKEGPTGIAVLQAKLEGQESVMEHFWTDPVVASMCKRTPETEEMANYLVGGAMGRDWMSRTVREGYITDDDAKNLGRYLKVEGGFPEPRPFGGDPSDTDIVRVLGGETTGEKDKPGRSFGELQETLEKRLDLPENEEEERVLKEDRQFWVKKATELGVLKGIKEAVDASLGAGADFDVAYKGVRDLESRLPVYIREAKRLPGWEEGMEGVIEAFYVNAKANYGRAQAKIDGDGRKEKEMDRRLDLLGWGTVPRGRVDAAASKTRAEALVKVREEETKKLQQLRELELREAREATERAAAQQPPPPNQAAQDLTEAARLMREAAAAQVNTAGSTLPNLTMFTEEGARQVAARSAEIETKRNVLLAMLDRGFWGAGVKETVEGNIPKLTNEKSWWSAVYLLVDDLARGKKKGADIGEMMATSLTSGAMIEIMNTKGAMSSFRRLCKGVGLDFDQTGAEYFSTRVEIDRKVTLKQMFSDLGVDESRVFAGREIMRDKGFWELAQGDWTSVQELMMRAAAIKKGLAPDQFTVKSMSEKILKNELSGEEMSIAREVLVAEMFMRHTHLVDRYSFNPDHPLATPGHNVYHLYMEAVDRALNNKEGKPCVHTAYMKANEDQFPFVDKVTGEYKNRAGEVVERSGLAKMMFLETGIQGVEPNIYLFDPYLLAKGEGSELMPTLWDRIRVWREGEVMTSGMFNQEKGDPIMKAHGFRVGATVAVFNEIFGSEKERRKLDFNLAKPLVWDFASDVIKNVVQNMGMQFEKVASEEPIRALKDETITKIQDVAEAILFARMGMGQERDTLAIDEIRTEVLSAAFEGFNYPLSGIGSVPVLSETTVAWVAAHGRGIPVVLPDRSGMSKSARFGRAAKEVVGLVFKTQDVNRALHDLKEWLKEDELTRNGIKILAWGLNDAASVATIKRLGYRRESGGVKMGGPGTHSDASFKELIRLSREDKVGYSLIFKAVNKFDFNLPI